MKIRPVYPANESPESYNEAWEKTGWAWKKKEGRLVGTKEFSAPNICARGFHGGYNDNFGLYQIESEEDIEFYHRTQCEFVKV